MDKIITGSGREFDCDFVSTMPYPPRAYIRICNSDIATIAGVFSVPEETENLKYGSNTLSYSRLVAIIPEGNAENEK